MRPNPFIACLAAALALAACAENSRVTITQTAPVVQTASRSEPIFYNGKTYRLDYSYAEAAGNFDMRVSGMGAKQQKDAAGLATSALSHFACPTGQPARAIGAPSYASGVWMLQAKCG